jgi:YidC/Oxa1 family membrane protein insertase
MEENKGLDRNQIAGFVLIAVIMVGFGWWQSKNAPTPTTEVTTEVVADQGAVLNELATDSKEALLAAGDSAVIDSNAFVAESISISNGELELLINTKGAIMEKAALADYHNYDDSAKTEALAFVDGNQVFDLKLPGGETLSSQEFEVVSKTDRLLVLSSGSTKVSISLPESGFLFDYTVSGQSAASGKPELFWSRDAYRTEKGMTTERQYSTFSYKVSKDGDVEFMSSRGGDDTEDLEPIEWLSQKQRFFSMIVHPMGGFAAANISTVNGAKEDNELIKKYSSTATFNTVVSGAYEIPMRIYLGPNHYQTLKDLGEDYEKSINFGWGIFGWIGRGVVVPIFNWLEGKGLGYGLIIFIMVLIIKGALSPLTFASYKSMAKMRVLKPQLDAINEKYGEKDQMAKQQAQMSLYREAGVNPLGGCIPVLVQMPILIAMFRFFPASIELRGESFLWANDLSTYDSIISWGGNIPLISTFFGNHLSLFTVLMTGSTILYTWMNQQMTPTTGNADQMKQMRVIMYLMPLMFMFVLNSYPSGLTYYYFLSNIVTFAMQWGIRKTVNDEAILAKLEAKKAQPKKKTKFQERLEEMQRQQNLNRSQRRG